MPNSRAVWNPEEHQIDPLGDLTVAIRQLRMGDALAMPDGTVVRSAAVVRGGTRRRQFAVVPPEKASTPIERHRIRTLGKQTYDLAEQAARVVLKQ